MRRLVIGVSLGLVFGVTASGLAQPTASKAVDLEQEEMIGIGRESFVVPPEYGHLVTVAVSSGVHHMYFEDSKGTIRIVLVGPSGSSQRARHGLVLLSQDVYVITRQHSESTQEQ